MWNAAASAIEAPMMRRLYTIGFVFDKSRNAIAPLCMLILSDIAHLHFRAFGDPPQLPLRWMGAHCPSIDPGALRIGAHENAAPLIFAKKIAKYFYFFPRLRSTRIRGNRQEKSADG